MSEKIRVLVIDDEPDMRDMIRFVLEFEGFEIETAGDGNAALATLEEQHFDAVISDLRMPGLSGIDTIERLFAERPGLNVIVATGYVTPEVSDRLLAQGAKAVLRKPFEMSLLVDELRRVVKPA